MYRPNLQSIPLLVPEIIAIAVLGWGCEPPILGKGGRRGSGMVPFERVLVSSYSTRFRDRPIAACVLQDATFPHSISSLPEISPCFPESRWMAFGLRRTTVWG